MSPTDLGIIDMAIALFLIANPIGNTPAILAVVRPFSFKDQKRIIFRESLIALALALFFQFFGEVFLSMLTISESAVGYCGGVLLVIVAMQMIFAKSYDEDLPPPATAEPFIVPIATPIIMGAGTMTLIMLYSRQVASSMTLTFAILLAWVGVIFFMVIGPYLQKVLRKRGMIALEQLMGMILTFMAVDLIVNATVKFKATL